MFFTEIYYASCKVISKWYPYSVMKIFSAGNILSDSFSLKFTCICERCGIGSVVLFYMIFGLGETNLSMRKEHHCVIV